MKLIVAVIKPFKLEEVKDALAAVVSRVMLIPDYGFGSNHAGADSRAESVVRSVVGISDRKMSQAVVMPDVMA